MGILENYNFDILVNEAERLIREELERQLSERGDVCTCEDCVLDMAALALNSVKPVYRVSLMGSLYAHSLDDSEYAEQVRQAVYNAVEKISMNPSHD